MRSDAESCEPEFLSNCSEREPVEGVYLELTSRKPSAKVLMAEVRVLYSAEEEVYVPAVTEESNWWKKASEVDVTFSEPSLSQVMRAS